MNSNLKQVEAKMRKQNQNKVVSIKRKIERMINAGLGGQSTQHALAEVERLKSTKGKRKGGLQRQWEALDKVSRNLGTIKDTEKKLGQAFENAGFKANDMALTGSKRLHIMNQYFKAVTRLKELIEAGEIAVKGQFDSDQYTKKEIQMIYDKSKLNLEAVLNSTDGDIDGLAIEIGRLAGIVDADKITERELGVSRKFRVHV